ncbi:glycosyltransferase family 2 protein [Mariniblastus fucicola]|uniref:Undecaprenyl-phosphate 4-deoxy-4-formamido-L-arabinose transferase n=1 Tax=Mariniblastus fucicola TaxID=980251 RepID=A0A5B9P4V4_9BACT|nr:glycosyltransferase family 2 protein [Mariniblastus fucicola]QEG21314.1 Undecaprenyl-phosphate 4-deoxy-4-formamido-L-arabinose transferase [Mariniblastus fucicola]
MKLYCPEETDTETAATKTAASVSIVVPVFNEFENTPLMYDELTTVMQDCDRSYELIFVDDGSVDGTRDRLKELASRDDRVKLVLFRRNYGQSAAMLAGMQHATMDYVVTIDGDLQNDPVDIPMMLGHLDDGYDLVHGWRKDRQDKLVSRKIPSKIANWLISRTTGFPIHDLGCTLKAIRREIASQIELYGEMHRFIPILGHQLGAKSIEVVTNHRARQFGETKYGIGRTFRVVLDLMTVKFMLNYLSSPMKLFGKLGLWTTGIGVGSLLATIGMRLFSGIDMTGNPLLLLGAISIILGVQFFSLGLIGEMCVRIYYGNEKNSPYQVRETVNFEGEERELKVVRAA